MTAMEAYFDESGTHHGSADICIAGYLFEKDKAADLDAVWQRMLQENGLPFFHMVDCVQGTGPFAVR